MAARGTTVIMECTCEHEHQDKIHGKDEKAKGKKMRVHNVGAKTARCTVCQREKSL